MHLIAFVSNHLLQMKPRPLLQPNLQQNVQETGLLLEKLGPAYTLIDDNGKVLGCGGIALMWPGVGSAWLYLNDKGRPFKLKFKIAKACSKQLKEIINQNCLHRVQAEVHSQFYLAQRFVTWLGFKSEGMAKAFGSDGSHWIHYAITQQS